MSGGPLSPPGRGREAMTYGRAGKGSHSHAQNRSVVSHVAELVRGDFFWDLWVANQLPNARSSASRARSSLTLDPTYGRVVRRSSRNASRLAHRDRRGCIDYAIAGQHRAEQRARLL